MAYAKDSPAPASGMTAKMAATRNPLYTQFLAVWTKLGDVREGIGGFLDGTYLIAHPREWLDHTSVVSTKDVTTGIVTTTTATNPTPRKPSAKLKARRALASYNNIAAAIIDAFRGPLFRVSPTRRVGDTRATPTNPQEVGTKTDAPTPIELWWANVHRGKSMDEMMPRWWDLAASFGHMVLYFDLPNTTPVDELGGDPTAADQGQPRLCWYDPRDILDWLEDTNGYVTAIKVREAVPPVAFDYTRVVTHFRIRVLNDKGWWLYDEKTGGLIDHGDHQLGRVPFVYLFGQESPTYTTIGKSILGDPQNHIDLYNLESEQRELLRNQTFSFINLPLGTGQDAMTVEEAQALIGKQTGTMNMLFSALPAQILTGDAANVDSYETAKTAKRREIYREAGVQWESDSKVKEAEGSLQLKREDMNTRLSSMANNCQMAEYELADLFYRFTYGAERGPQRLKDDEVTIHYPDTFDETPFDNLILQIQAAQTMGMPTGVLKELRKAILPKLEGMSTLVPGKLKELLDEIDAMADDPTPQERMQQKMDILSQSMKTGQKPPGEAKNLNAA